MNKNDVRKIILDRFKRKKNFESIEEQDDFFDKGISSLTIVELQVQIEEALGITIPTTEIMILSTINEWVNAYSNKIHGLCEKE